MMTISDMWAFVSVDDSGHEELLGMRVQDHWQPLVSIEDGDALDKLRTIARLNAGGREVKLVHFTAHDVVSLASRGDGPNTG